MFQNPLMNFSRIFSFSQRPLWRPEINKIFNFRQNVRNIFTQPCFVYKYLLYSSEIWIIQFISYKFIKIRSIHQNSKVKLFKSNNQRLEPLRRQKKYRIDNSPWRKKEETFKKVLVPWISVFEFEAMDGSSMMQEALHNLEAIQNKVILVI